MSCSHYSKPAAYPELALRPVGQHISGIYRDRIAQFTSSGQWENYNLKSVMCEGRASGEPHIKLWVWHAPNQDRPTFKHAAAQHFEPTHLGVSFGPSWTTHWFRVELTVPKELQDKEHLEFHWDAHNEGMVWSEDGIPLQGLTGDGERVEWILPMGFRDGKPHVFFVEMACNGMFGNASGGDSIQPPDPDRYFQLTQADIVAVNLQARALSIDIWIIGDAAREFPSETWQQHKALDVATRIIETFDKNDMSSLDKCRAIAQEYLGKLVDSPDVYSTKQPAQVFGIGHCHIDTCWLWPWAETKRKVARSWTNQCNLIEQYPELNFACSQAQQYKWLEQFYPEIFQRVKEKIKAGNFHPIGGSWVEHDTNMPSGESLTRQFLYGQRYFESRFGIRCKTFWLPDTFGYSGQIPQLCRLADMNRFLTQKLSWNNINKFPHTTFNWVALDGTQVMCHMPPAETYTAEAHFGDVRRSQTQHKSMDQDVRSLLVFGKGDGGGGPTWQHVEKLRRCRGLSDQVGLLPRVHLGDSVDDFFDKVQEKATDLVTWYGELYFELHRGTYTTQANNKKNNRKTEALMRDLELLATVLSLEKKDYKYPKKDIDFMWEAILLCQFHDCLPGSSIEMCYDDSDELYRQVFKKANDLLSSIHDALKMTSTPAVTADHAVAINTLPWPRTEIMDLSPEEAVVVSGSGSLLTVTPFAKTQSVGGAGVSVEQTAPNTYQLTNSQYKILVKDGVITSLYDLTNDRETIEPGQKANQFVIFDDKPLYWQAWDVEVYHLDSRKELKAGPTTIAEVKPHRVQLATTIKISEKSSLTSYISLSAVVGSEQSAVLCHAEVDWHEAMTFLKVEFPVAVRNMEASYETSYGITRRPTHYNTSWDMAKFEVCCHRFADLSEANYGVSVLNESKYGFATCGNLMRLSLLRSPKAPDAHADMGRHSISWAILPHAGPLGVATVRAAYEFNTPLQVLTGSSDVPVSSLSVANRPIVLTGDDSLMLDCVKRGEDDEDVSVEGPESKLSKKGGRSVIMRVYESLGGRGRAEVKAVWPVKKVFKTNILEDEIEEVKLEEDGRFKIDLRPFEVATYKLVL